MAYLDIKLDRNTLKEISRKISPGPEPDDSALVEYLAKDFIEKNGGAVNERIYER